VEVGGLDDQVQARNLLAFHGRLRDYWSHQDTADRLLTAGWGKVRALAEALVRYDRLTGDQAAELIDLTNPSPRR
jgi:hypothetical protein